jgi:hypothetical protein
MNCLLYTGMKARSNSRLAAILAAQPFVGGGLSAMGGMSYGGFKSKWLNVENKGTRMTNKFLHYGMQSTAYDFAYSKQKDFLYRPVHDRVAMFLFSGISGSLSSEAFSGKLSNGIAPGQGLESSSIRKNFKSAALGTLFNGFGAYMGGRSKGGMEKYYNKRSQRNKSALILMKSFSNALYYWK